MSVNEFRGRVLAAFWMIAFVLMTCGQAVAERQDTAASKKAQELIEMLDSKVKRRYYSHHPETNGFERVLQELIKLGSAAEDALESKVTEDVALRIDAEKLARKLNFEEFLGSKEADEVDRLSNNLELLTALRRVQKKPDPLSIEVIRSKDLKAIPGKLPTFSVRLKSVDIEKTSVWVQRIPHYHGSRREAQWRFEVKTGTGKILSVVPNLSFLRTLGGIKSDGWLEFGGSLDSDLPMGDFINISEPGKYTVTLMYHPKLPIADETDVTEFNDLIIFRSEPFELVVDAGPQFVIESSKETRTTVHALIAELPNEGIVKIIRGVYRKDHFKFFPPKSPAGKILLLNWRAVPALLDSLSDLQLSRHRKAWVLSLLYSITGETELDPTYSSALPAHQGWIGRETPDWSDADLSDDTPIVSDEQDTLIARWQSYREQYLDIREIDAK